MRGSRCSLAEYVERMKDGQKQIFYATGETRQHILKSPHLEAFKARGYEVLLLTDPVDEVWVGRVTEFEGKPLQSVARREVDLDSEEEKTAHEAERVEQEKGFADLLNWLKETLSENVKEVRLSSRLTESPACLITDAFDITPALARLYRASGQNFPVVSGSLNSTRIIRSSPALRSFNCDRSRSRNTSNPDLFSISPCARLSRARTTTRPPSHHGLLGRQRTCPGPDRLPGIRDDHGWFPRSLHVRSARQAPSSTPAASPHLRRRHSAWPPRRSRAAQHTRRRSRLPRKTEAAHCIPAHIRQIRAGTTLPGRPPLVRSRCTLWPC